MALGKGINVWSFPGGLDGTLDPIDALNLARDCGFDCVELGIGPQGSAFGLDVTDAQCDRIREEATRLGLRLESVASGLYWGRNLGDADPGDRDGAREDLERMIAVAARLGARTLLTIPGAVDVFFLPGRAALPYAHVWREASEGIRRVLPAAEAHRVRLGIENVWNRFLLSPNEMASFIDQFASPWVGAYVDVANLLPFGYAQDWLRHLGPRVVGVHFKDFRRAVGTAEGFVDLLEGDVDWPEVVAALEAIGYDGPCVAEMIPLYRHHPLVRAHNASRAMDAILSA